MEPNINKQIVSSKFPETIKFLRRKDYQFKKPLGKGSCGETILIHDSIINEDFVCKKYSPIFEEYKEELFDKFISEIKLLHLIYHPNIVRVFNYHIYKDHTTGYILMEVVNGTSIDKYLEKQPEKANEVFEQVINGFAYLGDKEILHRDIRNANIMVDISNIVKIIDFGFGKKIDETEDFGKSISLNWPYDPPEEFNKGIYDFCTEVYFIGKLFEKIIQNCNIEHFKYKSELHKMCIKEPEKRFSSFYDIQKSISENQFLEIDFKEEEKEAYRNFVNSMSYTILKIERDALYYEDILKIQTKLENIYSNVMLEDFLPNPNLLTQCFINGAYYFNRKNRIHVDSLKEFIVLLKKSSIEKKNIIFNNIKSRLDAIDRYKKDGLDDEIPF